MGAAEKNQKKLKDGTFKHIEAELYNYWESRKELKRLKLEIVYSHHVFGDGIRNSFPGNPTQNRVIAILSNRRIQELERIVTAIRTVYERLPEEKRKLVELKYWTRPQILTWDGIAQQLHVSRRMALYWRNEIVYAIAEQLGWQ